MKNQSLLKVVSSIDEISFDILKKNNTNLICIVPYTYKELFNKLNGIYSDIYLGISNKDEELDATSITNNLVFINNVLYLNKNESNYYKYAIMMRDKKNVLDKIKEKGDDEENER